MSDLDGIMLGAIRYRSGVGHGQSVEDRAWLLRYIDRHKLRPDLRAELRERIGLLRAGLEPDDAYVYTRAWLRGTDDLLAEEDA